MILTRMGKTWEQALILIVIALRRGTQEVTRGCEPPYQPGRAAARSIRVTGISSAEGLRVLLPVRLLETSFQLCTEQVENSSSVA